MTKKHPKPDPKGRFEAILSIDLRRIRWIEPIPRSDSWWPVPRRRRTEGGC